MITDHLPVVGAGLIQVCEDGDALARLPGDPGPPADTRHPRPASLSLTDLGLSVLSVAVLETREADQREQVSIQMN